MDTVEDFVERAMAFNPLRRRDVLRRSLLHNLRQLPSGKWTWKYDPNRFGQQPGSGPAQTVAARWNDVRRIACPTLVVRGGRSDLFHDEDAENLATTPRRRPLGADRGGQSHGPGRPTTGAGQRRPRIPELARTQAFPSGDTAWMNRPQ
jgi:hypothetical protein